MKNLLARVPSRLWLVLGSYTVAKLALTLLGFTIITAFAAFSPQLANEGQRKAAGHPLSSLSDFDPVLMWFRYDAFHYQWLTETDYLAPLNDYERMMLGPQGHGSVEPPVSRFSFTPMLPLLAKVFLPLVGDARVAVLIVANLSLIGLLWATSALAEELWDAETGRMAVVMTLAAPTAFLLQAGLTESLFTGLSVVAVLMCVRRQWAWMAVFGFMAGLTRSSGFLIAMPLGLIVLTQVPWRDGWRSIAKVLVPGALASAGAGLGFGAFLLYCKQLTGNWMAYSQLQKVGWGIEPRMPWEPILEALARPTVDQITLKAWLVIALVVLALVSMRWVPWPLGLYCVLLLALPMASLTYWHLSIIRYASGLFALTLLLALVARRVPWLAWPIVTISALYQGFLFTTWILEWTAFIV